MERTTVTAAIHFLKHDSAYSDTKPYAFQYELEGDEIPRTNIETEEVKDIRVHDMRGSEQAFTMATHGFEIMPLRSELTHRDFDDASRLPVYFRELEALLKQRLGASEARVFRHGIRKRHPKFPVSTGQEYGYDQPTSVAHIDTTREELLNQVQQRLPEEERRAKVEWINAWKPLRGPLNDWPLVLCDASSVDPPSDLEAADLLYPDRVTENYQVYHREAHKWYYLSDHRPDEIMVFRQASTSKQELPGKSDVR